MKMKRYRLLYNVALLIFLFVVITGLTYAQGPRTWGETSALVPSGDTAFTHHGTLTSGGDPRGETRGFQSVSWSEFATPANLDSDFGIESAATIQNPTWVYTLTSQALSVAMSESPRSIVVGTHNHGLVVLDEAGEIAWSDLADREGVHVAISQDGSLITAVARENGRICAYDRQGNILWSYDTGYVLPTSWEADRWLIDMSADGNTIVAVLDDGYVVALDRQGNVMWQLDFTTQQPFTSFSCQPDETGAGEWVECIQSMDVSGDGNTIAIGTWDSDTDEAVLFSFNRDGALRWQQIDTRAESVAVSPDGQLTIIDAEIVYCFDDEGNQLWSAPDPSERWSLSWSSFPAKHVAISNDGQRIYGVVGDWVAGWDTDGNELWNTQIPDPLRPTWLETDAGGSLLAIGTIGAGSVFLYDGNGDQLWYWISLEHAWVKSLTMSNDGTKILAGTCCDRNGAFFWDWTPSVAEFKADFAATPRTGPRPLEVRFTNLSSGAIDSQVWDFGDGNDSGSGTTLFEPIHTYHTTGTFTVTLTITGPSGSDSAVKPNYITVWEATDRVYLPCITKDYVWRPTIPVTPLFEDTLALGGVDYAVAQDDSELDVGSQSGEMTIEAWVNIESFVDGEAKIVSKPGAYALYLARDPSIEDFTCVYFELHTTCGDHVQGSCSRLGPGWHHIMGQLDQVLGVLSVQTCRISVDGGYAGVGGYLGVGCTVNDSVEALVVGQNLNGQVEELRISATARYTDTYVVPSSPFTCDDKTRALWHFDEPGGTTTFHDMCGKEDNVLNLPTP